MTAPTAHLDAARLLGIPVREIADVGDSPAGTLITTTDGVIYVHVPEEAPDADGKSGLMYLAKPHSNDAPVGFPVFAQETDEDAPTEDAADPGAATDVPTGSIGMIVGWVHELGEGHVAARAAAALAAEQAQAKPRVSLVAELEQLAGPTTPEGLSEEEQGVLDQLEPEEAAALLALDDEARQALRDLSDEDLEALLALDPEDLEQLQAGQS